jgi:membrane-associated HD superfamily phosphohydrolase
MKYSHSKAMAVFHKIVKLMIIHIYAKVSKGLKMTKQINTLFAVLMMVLLMIVTRGHDNWLSSMLHLPDFTIPALFIAGVYFRKFWVVFTLILSSVAVQQTEY